MRRLPTLEEFDSTGLSLRAYLDAVAKSLITEAMKKSEQRVAAAAELLKTNRTTLHMRFIKGIMKEGK